MKLATVFGACSGISFTRMSPCEVLSVANWAMTNSFLGERGLRAVPGLNGEDLVREIAAGRFVHDLIARSFADQRGPERRLGRDRSRAFRALLGRGGEEIRVGVVVGRARLAHRHEHAGPGGIPLRRRL